MKSAKMCILTSLVIFYSHAVFSACIQTNNTVGLVGSNMGSNVAYASLSGGSKQCSCNEVRFNDTNADVKTAVSILLAAKMGDKTVRVDMPSSGDCDSAYSVFIE